MQLGSYELLETALYNNLLCEAERSGGATTKAAVGAALLSASMVGVDGTSSPDTGGGVMAAETGGGAHGGAAAAAAQWLGRYVDYLLQQHQRPLQSGRQLGAVICWHLHSGQPGRGAHVVILRVFVSFFYVIMFGRQTWNIIITQRLLAL